MTIKYIIFLTISIVSLEVLLVSAIISELNLLKIDVYYLIVLILIIDASFITLQFQQYNNIKDKNNEQI